MGIVARDTMCVAGALSLQIVDRSTSQLSAQCDEITDDDSRVAVFFFRVISDKPSTYKRINAGSGK